MISLPENFLNSAFVDNSRGAIILHFRNSTNQYFTYMYIMDKAFSFDQHMDILKQRVANEFIEKMAYVLRPDLTTDYQEPTDQNWVPAPLPGATIISFAQYKAHAQLANKEDAEAKLEEQNGSS